MTDRIFPDWINAYLEYTAESEAPTKFHFWTAISVIAGALRRKVCITQGYFDWVPNFYIIFVSPPGIVSKSTTISIGMDLLKQVPDIKFGPDSLTWQALAMSMAEATELVEMGVNETGEQVYQSMSALTIASSEFGNLLNPNDREMVDFLVSLWDSRRGVWKKVTKTSGTDTIENPWINIVACTTPAWIAGYFPEYLIGGGFTSRCVFVFADQKRHLRAYPGAHLPANFKEQEQLLIRDLEKISMIKGEYKLSTEAIAWGEEWYENLHKHRPAQLDNDKFAGYIARKQSHIHKLAMVIAASKHSRLVLEPQDLIAADGLVTALESDLPKVFYTIGQTQSARHLATVMSLFKAYGEMAQPELYKKLSAALGKQEIEAAVGMAISANLVKMNQRGDIVFLTPVKAA